MSKLIAGLTELTLEKTSPFVYNVETDEWSVVDLSTSQTMSDAQIKEIVSVEEFTVVAEGKTVTVKPATCQVVVNETGHTITVKPKSAYLVSQ